MTELRDGFFYHPDGNSPEQQMQRLLSSDRTPAFDSLFSTTIQEADREIKEAGPLSTAVTGQQWNLHERLALRVSGWFLSIPTAQRVGRDHLWAKILRRERADDDRNPQISMTAR